MSDIIQIHIQFWHKVDNICLHFLFARCGAGTSASLFMYILHNLTITRIFAQQVFTIHSHSDRNFECAECVDNSGNII